MRLDDTEPGDVEPFIWHWASSNSFATYSRTSQTSFFNTVDLTYVELFQTNGVRWKGYVARDCPQTTRDVASYFMGCYRNASHNAYLPSMNVGQPSSHRVANHPSTTPPFLRDFVSVVTDCSYTGSPSLRMHKGTVRWFQLTSNGAYKDTFDTKQWLMMYPYGNAISPGILVGPWDGSTTPT